MFYGEYRHTIDTKGRLFIPAKLREKLGDNFMISRGLDNCVCIYPMSEWEHFKNKLDGLTEAEHRRLRRFFFTSACEGATDSQGRVTLTQSYRNYAQLEKEVVIVGNCSHLELWSSEAWEAEQQLMSSGDVTKALIEIGF